MMNRNNKIKPKKTNSRINANLYSVIEAVNASIKPGEEELVPWVVKHIIETHSAEQVH